MLLMDVLFVYLQYDFNGCFIQVSVLGDAESNRVYTAESQDW